MFKEKYLICQDIERGRDSAPSKPNPRAALSQSADSMADSLTEISTDQILIDVFGTNLEDAKIALAKDFVTMDKSLQEDAKQNEYTGMKYNGQDFVICWQKGGKIIEKPFSNYFPQMEPADFDRVALLFSEPEKNRAIEKQVNEFCTKQVGNFLMKKGFDLPYEKFMNSYLVRRELAPVLTGAYKQGASYEFVAGENGFSLKNESKGFPEQHFDLADYDDQLNLLDETADERVAGYVEKAIAPDPDISGLGPMKMPALGEINPANIDNESKTPAPVTKDDKPPETKAKPQDDPKGQAKLDESMKTLAKGLAAALNDIKKTETKSDDEKSPSKKLQEEMNREKTPEEIAKQKEQYRKEDQEYERKKMQKIQEYKLKIVHLLMDFASDVQDKIDDKGKANALTWFNHIDNANKLMRQIGGDGGLREIADKMENLLSASRQKLAAGEYKNFQELELSIVLMPEYQEFMSYLEKAHEEDGYKAGGQVGTLINLYRNLPFVSIYASALAINLPGVEKTKFHQLLEGL